MAFKQITYWRLISYIVETSQWGSPIRWDDWCKYETERMGEGYFIVTNINTPHTKMAIFKE
jgi:hypothetical protein